MTITPRVINLSQYNVVETFDDAIALGIWGIIHRSTESNSLKDIKYNAIRKWAKDKNLLWGACHLLRPGTVVSQMEHFINIAKPDDDTLLVLDWTVNSINLDFVVKCLRELERRTNRKAILYSGNTAREALEHNSQFPQDQRDYLGSHRLWHAQYSKTYSIASVWEKPWLWQYSGDGIGQLPHGVDGITTGGKEVCDMNSYDGDREQLTSEWSGS